MWRRILACSLVLGLVACASSAPSAPPLESPSLPSGSVTLTPEAYFAMETKILQGQEALRIAREQLTRDGRLLTTLWAFSGALALALALDSIADLLK